VIVASLDGSLRLIDKSLSGTLPMRLDQCERRRYFLGIGSVTIG
jgi:hypothetical protein